MAYQTTGFFRGNLAEVFRLSKEKMGGKLNLSHEDREWKLRHPEDQLPLHAVRGHPIGMERCIIGPGTGKVSQRAQREDLHWLFEADEMPGQRGPNTAARGQLDICFPTC